MHGVEQRGTESYCKSESLCQGVPQVNYEEERIFDLILFELLSLEHQTHYFTISKLFSRRLQIEANDYRSSVRLHFPLS